MEKSNLPLPLSLLTVGLLALVLSFSATGCGCQQHSVSEVIITPATSCLTMAAGGGEPGNTTPGAVGLCEWLYLFGHNACAAPLTVFLPAADGSSPQQQTAAAGSTFEIEIGGWSEQDYELAAKLGEISLKLQFSIGGQCGLTGSCD